MIPETGDSEIRQEAATVPETSEPSIELISQPPLPEPTAHFYFPEWVSVSLPKNLAAKNPALAES
jgi:hypothetical protein